jgi:ABC-type transport system involved in Fe-S cluster assembly fused permease/ATPase subunit
LSFFALSFIGPAPIYLTSEKNWWFRLWIIQKNARLVWVTVSINEYRLPSKRNTNTRVPAQQALFNYYSVKVQEESTT